MLNQPFSGSTNPSIQPIPLLNPLLASQSYLLDDRFFRGENFPFDPTLPLISPINPNLKLYPPSTRNYFNIDLLGDANYSLPVAIPGYNIFRQNPFRDFVPTPTNFDKISFNQSFTPSKEVSMQNKILINEEKELERTMTPSFKPIKTDEKQIEVSNLDLKKDQGEALETSETQREQVFKSDPGEKKKLKRPSLDVNLIENSETGKIFSASIANSYGKSNPVEQDNTSPIININTFEQRTPPLTVPNEVQSENQRTPTSGNIKFTLPKGEKPSDLLISPKSAFVKMK